MAIEIVSFPIKNGGSFHSYVKLPEGMFTVSPRQRACWFSCNAAIDVTPPDDPGGPWLRSCWLSSTPLVDHGLVTHGTLW